jgi:hypothetical protein
MSPQNEILIAGLGIYAGFVLSQFFGAMIRDIILPLLSPLASVDGGVSKLVITIAGIKINIGDALVHALNLVVFFMIVSMVLPRLREYVPIAGRR